MSETGRSSQKLLGALISIGAIVAAPILVFLVSLDVKENPRTEDAQVRANVVGIAPQVSGAISEIHVVDNQKVHRGDLLMTLDARPYEAEAARAKAALQLTDLEIKADEDQIGAVEASLKDRESKAVYARSYYDRVSRLLEKRYVTPDKVEQARTEADSADALVKMGQAEVQKAKSLVGEADGVNTRRTAAAAALRDANLKLSYCKIYAPCDGYVTNLQITPGAYAKAGEQMFSLVDQSIWYVLANFRETDLSRIKPGMPAEIYLMAESGRRVKGIVQGIPKAIYLLDEPSSSSPGGEGVLSKVRPTIDFILLAQRYPVRIVIDEPEAASFRMGGTASVIVHTAADPKDGEARLRDLQKKEHAPYESPVHE
ncbi:multidrug efflux transporter periplasmic adaptor subunit MdtN [soil metagenome]